MRYYFESEQMKLMKNMYDIFVQRSQKGSGTTTQNNIKRSNTNGNNIILTYTETHFDGFNKNVRTVYVFLKSRTLNIRT